MISFGKKDSRGRREFVCLFTGVAAAVLMSGAILAGCGGGSPGPGGDRPGPAQASATATLVDAAGRAVGTAYFTEYAQGGVNIHVRVSGLTPGQHGIHVHAVGIADPTTDPPFASAGGHFNPLGLEHGLNNPNGAHAGDLPNLTIDSAGNGVLNTSSSRFTLKPGDNTLFDADGSALIIHAAPDDQVTNPTGNSGGRVAGGVIVRD